MTPASIEIRPATESDVPLILSLIGELAEYERLAHEVTASEDRLRQSLFGPKPAAEVLIAEVAGRPAGYAVYFQNFSTFSARPGLYLEDVFVRPAFRGRGIGRRFMIKLAEIARERNSAHVQWVVLDWNSPAIDFYERLGAKPMNSWRLFGLSGDALHNLK